MSTAQEQVFLKWSDVRILCRNVINGIKGLYQRGVNDVKVYGVPRGGIYAGLALCAEAAHPKHDLPPFSMTNNLKEAPTHKPPRRRNEPCPCGSGKKYKKCHGR